MDFLHVGFGFWVFGPACGFGLRVLDSRVLHVGLGLEFWARGSCMWVWASGLGLVGFLLVRFGLWVVGLVGFWVLRVLRVWRLCLVCILPVYFGAPYAFNKITYFSKKILKELSCSFVIQ